MMFYNAKTFEYGTPIEAVDYIASVLAENPSASNKCEFKIMEQRVLSMV